MSRPASRGGAHVRTQSESEAGMGITLLPRLGAAAKGPRLPCPDEPACRSPWRRIRHRTPPPPTWSRGSLCYLDPDDSQRHCLR
jgi:hypothetical protein